MPIFFHYKKERNILLKPNRDPEAIADGGLVIFMHIKKAVFADQYLKKLWTVQPVQDQLNDP